MFTGLIEEIGMVKKIQKRASSFVLEIESKVLSTKCAIGDSIAVCGVCLTVVAFESGAFFRFDGMPETAKKSRLESLTVGEKVNLEKSLSLTQLLGGHLVYADVDTVATIIQIQKEGNALLYRFEIEPQWLSLIAPKGRVAIDGASLTVIEKDGHSFTLGLIPHSQQNLILSSMQVGDQVNVECDIVAKYCQSLLEASTLGATSHCTLEQLQQSGLSF